MLLREDYRGLVRRNRIQKVHRGGTKAQRTRPPDEVVTIENPALRIVSDALWEAAHALLAQRRRAFARRPAPPRTTKIPWSCRPKRTRSRATAAMYAAAAAITVLLSRSSDWARRARTASRIGSPRPFRDS